MGLGMSLELKNINRTFDGKTVIRNVSFTCKHGEIIGLFGTSGCGKSTLLRVRFLDLIQVLKEKYLLTKARRKRFIDSIGFIFQEPRLFPWLNVLENVTFGLKGSKEEKKNRVKNIRNVGLADSC